MQRWVTTKSLLETVTLTQPSSPGAVKPAARQVASDPPASSAKPEILHPGRMKEFEAPEPSLAARVRPDLGSAEDRHNAFKQAYLHPKARTETKDRKTRIRANRGSSNVTFSGQIEGGQSFIAKPHAGAAWGYATDPFGNEIPTEERKKMSAAHEPQEWSRRHGAMYEVMASMGAHHMVPVGIQGKMHSNLKETLAPDEEDPAHKAQRMAWTHAGQDAHIQEHVGPHEVVGTASDATLAKVDPEHRLHGIVAHMLFGHSDGHKENVLVHESGHPILIDHDFMLDSHYSKQMAEMEGLPTVVSVFGPGGKLDYRANRSDDVGVNYPPRMKATLQWLAGGGHMKGKDRLDISKGDAQVLQQNARNLLDLGLEGTLANYKVKPGG